MSAQTEFTPVTASVLKNSDLFTWKDPVKTGKVFGSIVLALLVFKKVNLFNVFFHLAYIGLLVSAAAEYLGKLLTGQGFITKYKPTNKSYAKILNEEFLPCVAKLNVKAEDKIQEILYAHDIETTLKGAGISYILYKITSLFSLFTLITAGVVILFTIPAIYVRNKKEIDAAVAQYTKVAKDKTSEYTKLAQEKAAPHIDNLVKKTGPVGSFIASKIPTRTAGSTVGTGKETSFANDAQPSTATTTGASQFPNVPESSTSTTTDLDEIVESAKSKAAKGEIPSSF